MAAQPDFYIIAGPNGAGKSTFGSLFLPPDTFYFNGDLVFAEICRRYPHIEPERLGGGVAVQLEKDREAALASRSDFAFESNYSNQMAIDISLLFKEAGYGIHLIVFGLPTLKDSTNRVLERIDIGGHDVPDEVIRFNREEGIERARTNLYLYDTINFVDTFHRYPERVAVYRKEEGQFMALKNDVEWFNRDFKSALEKLSRIHRLRPVVRKRPRKGRGPCL